MVPAECWNFPMKKNHGFSPPKDSRLLDPKVKTYLPAVGGLTIYTFGDARKLKDEKTEAAWKEEILHGKAGLGRWKITGSVWS